MSSQSARLIWIDLEMTGLDSKRDSIIEIATIVTDGELEVIAEGPVFAIHQPDHLLDSMDEFRVDSGRLATSVAFCRANETDRYPTSNGGNPPRGDEVTRGNMGSFRIQQPRSFSKD